MAIHMRKQGAGIYYNESMGLISLSGDGSNWITIADKNLGATQVYNYGDTVTSENCGGYFQRGNNYMFPWTGPETTSTTQIDASNYGPGNYYSSSIFIKYAGNWSSVQNNDLWGGETDTVEAKQGPCPNGFHIPSDVERQEVIDILFVSLGLENQGSTIMKYLKVPRAGNIFGSTGAIQDQGSRGHIWDSKYCNDNSAYYVNVYASTDTHARANDHYTSGKSIRPFKNTPVLPDDSWTTLYPEQHDYLCFTANIANSTVQLTKTGSPTSVTLETSTNKKDWNTYTIGDTITLSNIGNKIYIRNTSTTPTGFSSGSSDYYKFVMTGSISASGDINYLLCKNSTDTLSSVRIFFNLFNNCSALITCPKLPATTLTQQCYRQMFSSCSSLTTAPELPATTLAIGCYSNMFYQCENLEQLPNLPATTLTTSCYSGMFYGCPKIKISETQTGEYVNEYRIPITGTGSTATNAFQLMLQGTGGTFTGEPSINTTYYTSNTIV